MKDQNKSLVKSLPALLALTGGMMLGSAKSASAAVHTETGSQQSLDAKIKNLSERLNVTPGVMSLETGKTETGGIQTLWWGNWHNGYGPGFWRNGGWGNGGWRNGGWGNGGFRNWHNY